MNWRIELKPAQPRNNGPRVGGAASGFAITLAAWFVLESLAGAQTNVETKTSGLNIPDFDSLKVGGVRIGAPPVEVDGADGSSPFNVDDAQTAAGADHESRRGEWVAAPVPSLSPTFGFGLAGGVGYIYRPLSAESNSPPWVTGVGGFYSENGTWAAGLGHKMNLAEGRWRLLAFGGYANINYDFFGVGQEAGNNDQYVSLNQRVASGSIEALSRVSGHFYAGLRYSGSQVTTRYDGSSAPAAINDLVQGRQVDARLSTPSLRAQWDTRDNSFNPARGWLVDGEAAFCSEAFGSDFNYQVVTLQAKHYWTVAEGQVIALSTYGRFSFGDVPFFALSSFGTKNHLRGYPVGRYQDRMLLAGQAEYRLQLSRRFGTVAFGGVGAVAPDFGEFQNADALPSVGVGLRYMIAPKNKVNFRVDMAWGKDGHAIYLGVGESF